MACLGMALDILDSGRPDPVSLKHDSKAGKLVCVQPFPSEPLSFYRAGGMEKYRSSYFERFGNDIWCQGDLSEIRPDTKGASDAGKIVSELILNCTGSSTN